MILHANIRREEDRAYMEHQGEGSWISAQFCEIASQLDTWTLV